MLSIIKLCLGLCLLIGGANLFVAGASSLAKKLGISSLIIGLTIVAFGTSAPELAVSLTAGLQNENELVLGNVIGSNIFNLLCVVGLSAIIAPLVAEKNLLRRDWICSIFSTFGLLVLVLIDGSISRIDGLLLLIGFSVITSMQIYSECKNKRVEEVIATQSMTKTIISIILGFVFIIFGGEITVSGASEIAKTFGLSDTLIGLTIVAIGTSLPELVTSLVATKKGEYSIAIGNVIGSNIFNILFILGLTTLVNPIAIEVFTLYDIVILLIVSVLMFIVALKHKLRRGWGFVFVSMYIGYTVFLILR